MRALWRGPETDAAQELGHGLPGTMPPAALDPVQRAEQCHGELGLVGDAESVDVNDGRTSRLTRPAAFSMSDVLP